MKNRVIAVLFVLGLLAVAGKAQAQTMTFKTQVPFPFVVGNQTLPAGTYQIQRLMGRPVEGEDVGVIVVRGADRGAYKAVVTNLVQQPLESPSDSQLMFTRHAGQRYLSEVRIQGEKSHQIPNVFRESLGLNVSPERVALAELH